jgi:phosphoglucomutase
MAEMAAWAKDQGKTLFDILKDIYLEYGYSKEKMIYIVRKGISGAQEIESLMHTYRHNRPERINNSKIISVKDYLSRKETNLISGEESYLDFETTANVLQFYLEDGSKISVRPSGTEPKIKYYFEVREPLNSKGEFEAVNRKADQKIEGIIEDMELN